MNTVQCLNNAFKSDPNAIHTLIANRVPCRAALVDDEFVVVGQSVVLPPGNFQVGALGLVNAVLAANGLPLVASKWGQPDSSGRRQLIGFRELEPGTVPEA